MITAQTLVGLACLIAGGGNVDQVNFKEQLTETQKMEVSTMVFEEPCLPENFEKLVKKTEDRLKDNKDEVPLMLASPSFDCVKSD